MTESRYVRLLTFAMIVFALALLDALCERGLNQKRQYVFKIALRSFIAGAIANEGLRILL